LADITPEDFEINHLLYRLDVKKGANILKFEGTGVSDGYGATLTNVKLWNSAQKKKNHIENGNFEQAKKAGGLKIHEIIYIAKGPKGWTGEIEVGQGKIYNSRWGANQWVTELDTTHNTVIQQVVQL
jgi:hypothetical protein